MLETCPHCKCGSMMPTSMCDTCEGSGLVCDECGAPAGDCNCDEWTDEYDGVWDEEHEDDGSDEE